MIERAISKLNNLRSMTDWHPDTIRIWDEWERQLNQIELDETIRNLSQIKELADSIEKRVLLVNRELIDNRKIPESERNYLFALRDVCEIELKVFSKKDARKTIQKIERDIDYEAENFKK